MGIRNKIVFTKDTLNGFKDDEDNKNTATTKEITPLIKREYNNIPNGKGDSEIIEERNKICPHCNSKQSIIYSTNNFPDLKFKKCYRRCKNCKKNFISTKFYKK